MRSIIKVSAFILVIIASVIFTKQASAQQSNVSFQVFYDQLSPYGDWVNYPNWGYVWIPDAGPDFVPYSTDGHWILTDFGWTWMSDYSWGWAPFHYGRWDYDQYYGWFWVPGNEWGPAWVSWRRAEGYYGWAPLEPGISLSASFGRAYDIHDDHWIFVRDRDIDRADINHYYVSRTDQNLFIRRSSVINNTYIDSRRQTTYVTGPAKAEVVKVTGRQVNPVAIQEYNKPGQVLGNGHLQIYRPEVMKNNKQGNQPAPSRITNLKEVKQPSERKVTNQPGNSGSVQNIKDVRQTNPANSQKNVNSVKTIQSQNSNPPKNVNTIKQPVNVKSQNTNTSQNIKKDPQPNNVKMLNTNPPQNIKREQEPDRIKTLNTPPSQSNKRELQPNNVKTLNTNSSQKSVKGKQSNAAKPSVKSNNEQQNKSNGAEETKKKE
jgi:hypothetical protein